MDDLRAEIRAAFEKEQGAHPPASDLRPNLVRTAAAEPRPAPNFQWMAIAAAFLIAALVVVGLMSSRLNNRATVNPPGATPASTPTGDYGAPPAGVNLIYVHDPNHPSWLTGFDWSGKPRGTLKLDPTQTAVTMAPDGQTFALGLYAKGGNWQFLDRVGTPIGGPTTLPGVINPMWADDEKHVCGITFDQAYQWILWTQVPGETAKQVTVIARDSNIGQSFVGLLSCSFRSDIAIAVRTLGPPSEFWVIQLSTGKVLAHRLVSTPMASMVASGDSTLVAENSLASTAFVGAEASSARSRTTIRRLSDGSVVATIDGSMGVLAFSADNSRALVTLAPWVGGQPAHLGVVDVHTGRLVWQDEGTALFGGWVAEPGGNGFALAYPTTAQGPGPATILLVSGDGASTKLGVYAPTW